MSSPFFKYIPKKKYNPSFGIVFVVLGIVNFLLLLISFPVSRFRFELDCANIFINPQFLIRLWMAIGFTILGVIRYFTTKTAEKNYLNYFKNHPETNQLENETFCRKCGALLYNTSYKETKSQIIKSVILLQVKGYFCKKCFKSYGWKDITVLIFVLVLYLILSIPLWILYKNYLSFQFYFFLDFVLILFTMVLFIRIFTMVTRFRDYK